MNKPIENPTARIDDIVVQKLERETLLYDLKANKAFCLNETATLVWEFCDGSRMTPEISDEMSTELKVLVSEDVVLLALNQFQRDGLLEPGWNGSAHNSSRRQLIKDIGFVSVVALPVVSIVVAPDAATAQSCITNGNTGCAANNGACCDNNCAGTGGTICCATGVSHANPLPTGQTFCETVATCAASLTASLRCCSTGTASPAMGMCPTPGQIACACD